MRPEPFTISIPDDHLMAIRAKLADYDWDQWRADDDWRSGTGKADLLRLVQFWLEGYDWRAAERRMNSQPQFKALVDGEPIHFIHRQGRGDKPPILLLHGWPGSFLEFEGLIEPLTSEGHDVVVPSLPGYAFSNPITEAVGPRRTAELMHRLMDGLLRDRRFIVQGGDWGGGIGAWMALQKPTAMLGLHLNMLDLLTAGVELTTAEEKRWHKRRTVLLDEEGGYGHEQETRPQTLGAALANNPVGTAAWILEKFGAWADLPRRADGAPDLWSRFSEETLITNIMLYVATGAIATSLWMYRGKRLERSAHFPPGAHVVVPTGIAAFPDPVFLPPPRSLASKCYNVVHWTTMESGGHFAALEQPAALLRDLRTFIAKVQTDLDSSEL